MGTNGNLTILIGDLAMRSSWLSSVVEFAIENYDMCESLVRAWRLIAFGSRASGETSARGVQQLETVVKKFGVCEQRD